MKDSILKVYLKLQKLSFPFHLLLTKFIFWVNGVKYSNFKTKGMPYVRRTSGTFSIGNNFRMINHEKYNTIGRQSKCRFIVKGNLIIGNDVGMSSTVIVCHKKIIIGDNVLIGGNTVIYDTDFHSLNPKYRLNRDTDSKNTMQKDILIEKNVFIGAHTIVLKGTHIGMNSIIGAGSVISGAIPANEIWGGNPVKFIKKLDEC